MLDTRKFLIVVDIHDLVADQPRMVPTFMELVEVYGGKAPRDNRSFWEVTQAIDAIPIQHSVFILRKEVMLDYLKDCINEKDFAFSGISAGSVDITVDETRELIDLVDELVKKDLAPITFKVLLNAGEIDG